MRKSAKQGAASTSAIPRLAGDKWPVEMGQHSRFVFLREQGWCRQIAASFAWTNKCKDDWVDAMAIHDGKERRESLGDII